MSVVSDSTYMSSLGKGDSLHHKVLASFPLCDVTEEDLTRNPQMCKLMATLAQHVDKTGLTMSLKSELDKAEQRLQNHRRQWLCSESLYTGLQEMIQDCCVREHHSTVPPDQKMFCETVKRCLQVAQCVRQLDLSSTSTEGQSSILGLHSEQVLELMPPEKNVQRMKQSLPKELEKHLKKKCFNLLSYYQPECENESEGLKNSKLSHISAQMEKDKKRTESLNETCKESTLLLQRQIQLYTSELTKCIQLLQSLMLDHRLNVQTDLDRKKLEYFEGKCELVSQKIKAEMVDIQLDTYTPEAISAHKKIREFLDSELKACRLEKQSIELKLSSFEILGKDFETLAEEYCKLQQEIEMKKWALKEFAQYKNF